MALGQDVTTNGPEVFQRLLLSVVKRFMLKESESHLSCSRLRAGGLCRKTAIVIFIRITIVSAILF